MTASPFSWPSVQSDLPWNPADRTMSHGPAVKYISAVSTRFWEADSLAPSALWDGIGSVWEGTDNQPEKDGGFALCVYSGSPYVFEQHAVPRTAEPALPLRGAVRDTLCGLAVHVACPYWILDPCTWRGDDDRTNAGRSLRRPSVLRRRTGLPWILRVYGRGAPVRRHGRPDGSYRFCARVGPPGADCMRCERDPRGLVAAAFAYYRIMPGRGVCP